MRDKLLAYGMGPTKLYEKLNGNGHKITLQECKDLFYKYKDKFKTAIRYLESNRALARKELCMVNIAGRKRRWLKPDVDKIRAKIKEEMLSKSRKMELTDDQDETCNRLAYEKLHSIEAGIEREGGNFPIQSTNVEWTKESMYEIRKACKKRNYDARFYNSVYDETVLDTAAKDAQEVHELQKKIMIECGQKYCKHVPVEVEGHLEAYWTK